MDLFEYQGKQLLRRLGVPTPEGEVAETPEEAEAAARSIGGRVAVKAQVQVGGRGKAGGIKVASTPEEAREAAEAILGMDIKGHLVRRVWVEAASDIASELYASFTLDRGAKQYLGMVSAKGGVDIEEVAATEPEAIARVHVSPLLGFGDYHARKLVFGAGIAAEARAGVIGILKQLYDAFIALDAELVEVNPLVVTSSGEVVALDAKVTVDDSALFRHRDFEELRDTFAVDPQERMAKEKGLNYIKLDGEVGIIGNGAGLVMSTLDLVAQAGGKAANFLDVGGGASAELITNALEVVTSDPAVRSVLINIFGGITRCELVAEGILEALGKLEIGVPIVIRLDGTNAPQGRAMLAEAAGDGGKLVAAETMLGAAEKAVELSKA